MYVVCHMHLAVIQMKKEKTEWHYELKYDYFNVALLTYLTAKTKKYYFTAIFKNTQTLKFSFVFHCCKCHSGHLRKQ